MRQFEIRSTRPPYGVRAEWRRQGIRLLLTSIADEALYVNLPRPVAEALRDELIAALAAKAETAA